jgi:TonB family protein
MKPVSCAVIMWQLFINPMFFLSWGTLREPSSNEGKSVLAFETLIQDQQRKKQPPGDFVLFDEAPKPISQVQPEYPTQAIKGKIEGIVWVKMWVTETGDVERAVISKSDSDSLNKSAIDAASKWKFKPAMMKGKPVATWVSVPFQFVISNTKQMPKEPIKDDH